ncbi:Glycerol 2-dehydrogenase (NADP(+)) [Hypoxylon texense]
MHRISSFLLLLPQLSIWAVLVSRAHAAADDDSSSSTGVVWVTPHDSYSSSIGVPGCKVNTNRVAYWPGAVDCDSICVSLTYADRSLHLLRVDQSQGAHDVSFDAWNYLYTGRSATDQPTAGGAIQMQAADADPGECADLLHTDGNKLPLSAANSMNFLASCLAQPDSWVAQNYVLYNILDPICAWGHDEVCTLDWPSANQATCPSALGDPAALTSAPVYNIRYPSGQTVVASSGEVVDAQNGGARCMGESAGLLSLGLMVAVSSWLTGAIVHL